MAEKALTKYMKSLRSDYKCVDKAYIENGYNIEFRSNLFKSTKKINVRYIMHPELDDYTYGFNDYNDFYNILKYTKDDKLEVINRVVKGDKILDKLRTILFKIEIKKYPVIIEKEDRKVNLYNYMLYYSNKLKTKYLAPIKITPGDKNKIYFKYSDLCGLECIEISKKMIETQDLNTILKSLKAQMIRLDIYNQDRPFKNTDKYFSLQLEKYGLSDMKKYIGTLKST